MAVPDAQAETARFLADLACAAPRETHVSAIFIGADTVWKLKKALRLPFLDFTTLKARRYFLLRELELNMPNAPAIYRDVVAICRQPDGSLGLGGADPVDWVLRMARVPDDDFLDVIAARKALTPALLDRLGDCVFRCHAALPAIEGWDSVGALRRIADGNLDAARSAGLPGPRILAWRQAIDRAIEHAAPMLRQRAKDGFVRRCHGDLHLANLCLWDGRPVAFDALEFDEALATIDVGYDLAFLLMDLDMTAGRAAANRVLNRYVARSFDVGIAGALGLFLSQRAFIRAHIANGMGDTGTAFRYLAAAEAYLSHRQPEVIAIGGLQGSGKTTLARLLAPELGPVPGALIIRSDEVRKRLAGVCPEQRLGPEAYTETASAAVNEALLAQVSAAARLGHSVIADSTCLEPTLPPRLQHAAWRMGLKFTGFWLTAPLPVLEGRIRDRQDDASDATVAVLRQAATWAANSAGWPEIDATDLPTALEAIRHHLSRRAGLPADGISACG